MLISTVDRESSAVNVRITAKHQYTCTTDTQADYILPRDAADKLQHMVV